MAFPAGGLTAASSAAARNDTVFGVGPFETGNKIVKNSQSSLWIVAGVSVAAIAAVIILTR